MPRRELKYPAQVVDCLQSWGRSLKSKGALILIGSGGLLWHVNLMPQAVLTELPSGWKDRASHQIHGRLQVTIPAVDDLLAPKLRRGEPRDLKHADWARSLGLAKGS